MRVRKNVYNLPAGDTTLVWYGRAVAEMRKLTRTDPRSWVYQAAIHGIADVPAALGRYWAQCQHASSFFLPWHRMYLLRFERIVAAQVAMLGGPADWALPYWDYSTIPAHRLLPPAFRDPTLAGGAPNPLYVVQRNPRANAGQNFMDDRDVDLKTCLRAAGTTLAGGFFGAAPSAHFGSYFGELELTPHNAVHVKVGRGGGWMEDPDLAALDPIFWLHHCNIDRLWEVWLKRDAAHKNLSTAYWLSGVPFDFHDENGTSISMRTVDVLDLAASALGYSYEDTSDPLAPAPHALAAGGPAVPTMITPSQAELVGATTAAVQLDSGVRHVQLPTPISPHAFRASSSPNAMVPLGPPSQLVRQVTLQLEHVTSSAVAPTYDVYVNVPDQEDPANHEDRFVSRVAMFGIAQASDPAGQHGGSGQNFAFDITELYHRLADANEVDPQKLQISFVPVEPEGDPKVSVGRISLYFA